MGITFLAVMFHLRAFMKSEGMMQAQVLCKVIVQM